jgi:hypothetical protein
LPKYWSYDVKTKIIINNTALDLIDCIDKQGVIIHKHEGILFDYEILLETGELVRVRESEINIVKE